MDDETHEAQDLTKADLVRMLDQGEPAVLGRGGTHAGLVVTPDRFARVTIDGFRATAPMNLDSSNVTVR